MVMIIFCGRTEDFRGLLGETHPLNGAPRFFKPRIVHCPHQHVGAAISIFLHFRQRCSSHNSQRYARTTDEPSSISSPFNGQLNVGRSKSFSPSHHLIIATLAEESQQPISHTRPDAWDGAIASHIFLQQGPLPSSERVTARQIAENQELCRHFCHKNPEMSNRRAFGREQGSEALRRLRVGHPKGVVPNEWPR